MSVCLTVSADVRSSLTLIPSSAFAVFYIFIRILFRPSVIYVLCDVRVSVRLCLCVRVCTVQEAAHSWESLKGILGHVFSHSFNLR